MHQAMAPVAVLLSRISTFIARMRPGHMSTAQPSEMTCLPQEPQSHNEAQDLPFFAGLCLQTEEHPQNTQRHPCRIPTNRTPCSVINEQDCRDIRTACCCIRSLCIRVEARANITERKVISRQLQLMQASVQHYPTEYLNTADTSCLSRTR